MGRAKLIRFKENYQRENILQVENPADSSLKGNWNSDVFGNDHPLTLELGCGKGKFSLGLATQFPERNHVGVDVKGDRVWVGSTAARRQNLTNVVFLRTQIQGIDQLFGENEVSEIWLTFPDPRPKGADARQRLTAPRFLDMYRTILHPDGTVNLKTDSADFFMFSLESIQTRNDVLDLISTDDLYQSQYLNLTHGIKTSYEEKFLSSGTTIKFLQFRFTPE